MYTHKQRLLTLETKLETWKDHEKEAARWEYLRACEYDMEELLRKAGVYMGGDSGAFKRRALAEDIVRYWTTERIYA
jgi:hypothetical protein